MGGEGWYDLAIGHHLGLPQVGHLILEVRDPFIHAVRHPGRGHRREDRQGERKCVEEAGLRFDPTAQPGGIAHRPDGELGSSCAGFEGHANPASFSSHFGMGAKTLGTGTREGELRGLTPIPDPYSLFPGFHTVQLYACAGAVSIAWAGRRRSGPQLRCLRDTGASRPLLVPEAGDVSRKSSFR